MENIHPRRTCNLEYMRGSVRLHFVCIFVVLARGNLKVGLVVGKIGPFVGIGDEIGLVVRIGPVVGIGLFGGTNLVVNLTYIHIY